METYYSKKEYNEMQSVLTRQIKNLEKKVNNLQSKNEKLKEQCKELSKTVPEELPDSED